MRRAWIEMLVHMLARKTLLVALHAESVDRNYNAAPAGSNGTVALHAESVDRNLYITLSTRLRAKSLSMRRAWIEIFRLCTT